jgi:hypothetical protein
MIPYVKEVVIAQIENLEFLMPDDPYQEELYQRPEGYDLTR